MSARKPASSKPLRRLAERIRPSAIARDVDLLDRVDEAEQVDPLGRVELADEPEVEEDEPLRRGVGQDVAGVRVAVEEAVDEDLLDDRARMKTLPRSVVSKPAARSASAVEILIAAARTPSSGPARRTGRRR